VLEKLEPVNEQYPAQEDEAKEESDDGFGAEEVFESVASVASEVTAGEDHEGVAQKFADEERGQGVVGFDLCHAGRGEESGGGERGQCVEEDEGPGAPEAAGQFFADEFEFLFFARFENFAGDFWDVETEEVAAEGGTEDSQNKGNPGIEVEL